MFWKKQKTDWYDDPRAHHYTFAHVALRVFCAGDPLRFFALMGSEEKDDLIGFLWRRVCEQCDEEETKDINLDEIKVSTFRLGDYPTIFVEMPEAKAVAEAIYVAIVLTAKLDSNATPEDVEYRYFVLEQGMDLDGNKRKVLCEWDGESHLNMGEVSVSNVESFLELLGSNI